MAAIEKGQSCGLERHELEPAEAVLKEAPKGSPERLDGLFHGNPIEMDDN
jgi:hypothetical protein